LPSAFRHSAKSLPSVRKKVLGKEPFADKVFAECSLPSVTLGKAFAECKLAFAECIRHSAKERDSGSEYVRPNITCTKHQKSHVDATYSNSQCIGSSLGMAI
jgi:hypothetical protein